MYGTPATKLVQDQVTKEILGVLAESDGKEVAIKAKRGVVMTLGGFENNPWMVGQYTSPGCVFHTRGSPGNTGDGIIMATEVGAQLWHMCGTEAYTPGVAPLPDEYPNMAMGLRYSHSSTPCIFVSNYGKRFYREDRGTGHQKEHPELYFDGWGDEPASRSDYPNYPRYLIFDQTHLEVGPIASGGFIEKKGLYRWSEDNSTEIASGLIMKADTIEELALKIKASPGNPSPWNPEGRMDPATLKETVTKYNQYCAAGEDPDFGRDPETLVPIETPPFYAVEAYSGFTNTQGGAKRNGNAQIVDRDDKPIPRLYGAGEFGSIYGFIYHGSGNVAEAVTVGKLAGENAAAESPWE
jgi:3-oxosteroid 1-dehydrogenase